MMGIEFFYKDHHKNQLVVCYKGKISTSNRSLSSLMDYLCERCGRSVAGSMELYAKFNNAHQKLAVLVNPDRNEIYFPTYAPSNEKCIWINYGQISKVKSDEDHQGIVQFQSGIELETGCSLRVIRRQMKRCEYLLKQLGNPYDALEQFLYS